MLTVTFDRNGYIVLSRVMWFIAFLPFSDINNNDNQYTTRPVSPTPPFHGACIRARTDVKLWLSNSNTQLLWLSIHHIMRGITIFINEKQLFVISIDRYVVVPMQNSIHGRRGYYKNEEFGNQLSMQNSIQLLTLFFRFWSEIFCRGMKWSDLIR